MTEFNHLAPGIDRAFRFVEMIGITALLGTILASQGPVVFQLVIFLGTLLAINYLIEPPVEWIAYKAIGEKVTIRGIVASSAIFAIAFALSVGASPFVGQLAVLIGKTIK